MKFAVISDIHGNYLALEAVLDDMSRLGVSEAVNLGDHFSGPLEARKTADLLMTKKFPSIRGNHDRQLLEQQPNEMGASDRVAFDQLEQKHIDWLSDLPPTMMYKDEVFLCHGTPISDLSYWLETVTQNAEIHITPIEKIEEEAEDINATLILCGHTHIPRCVELCDGRKIVNPGSVGAPGYDDDAPVYHLMQAGTPDASYAIVEKTGARWDVTFRLVPYDNVSMSVLAQENGRDEWASALATGWVR